jgi:peptidoglycan-associated lipoprotein
MQKTLLAMAVIILTAGCSTTIDEQKSAGIEDRNPAAVKPAPTTSMNSGSTVNPASTGGVGQNPLKDPGSILSKRSVYFDYDSNLVKDEFKPMVSAHAKYIAGNRSAYMTIQGNTDERGSREYNLALGQRRAESVKQMMTILGAQGSQIEAVSLGEEKPRAQGADESAFSENRRADIVYRGE